MPDFPQEPLGQAGRCIEQYLQELETRRSFLSILNLSRLAQWAGSTVWEGRTHARLPCSSWCIALDDVEQHLNATLRVAQQERAIYD